jgi:hypothetical protein
MNKYTDFTVDAEKYSDLKDWVKDTVIASGRGFVPIIDAAIGPSDSALYIDANANKIFI